MKKILSVMLMIAMLMTSTVALAEDTMTVYSINLSDIQMSENDEVLMDLTGMTVSLGAGVDDNGTAGLLSGVVTAGEEVALNAGIAVADGKLVANVDGMTQPLVLDLAALLTEENIQMLIDEIMAQFSDEELVALEKFFTAFAEMFSEESLLAMEEASLQYEEDLEALLMEHMAVEEGVGTVFIAGPDEELSSTLITIDISGEMMAEMMKLAFSIYDSNPAFIDLMNAALALDGEEPIESFSELYEETGMAEQYEAMDMLLGVYVSDDYDNGYIDVVMEIYDATAEEETLLAEIAAGINVVDAFEFVMTVTDPDSGEAFYAELSVIDSEEFPGESEISAYAGMIYDDGQEQLLNLWIGPDADYGTLGTLVIGEEGDAVGAAWGFNEETQVLNLYDEYGTSITMGLTTDFEGAEAGERMIYFEMADEELVDRISAVLSFSAEEIALADVQTLAAAEGINILEITAEDEDQLYADIEAITLNTMLTLAQNVEGIATLLGMGE